MPIDYYETLGVAAHDDHATVRAAYLRVMRRHHPDLRPGDAHAEHPAREANAAWHVLGNSARRAAYDRLRSAGPGRRTGSCEARSLLGHRQVGVDHAAYSSEGASYRRAFSHACLRLGTLVFAVGAVLLLAFSNG